MSDILYNKFFGRLILNKYIDKKDRRYTHSVGVANFSRRVAARIKHRHPEFSFIDPEFSAFLGYVHDIGYSVSPDMHELHTIDLLIKEGMPKDIAIKTSHGQIPEQYGPKDSHFRKYYPSELDGMILTYANMTVSLHPMYMEERVIDIRDRVEWSPLSKEKKEDIIYGLEKAFPRYLNYEATILSLAGVRNYTHFGIKKIRINKGSKNSRRRKKNKSNNISRP
jgi:hypothetical protein